MAGPLKLISWEGVGLLLLFVFLAAMSEIHPSWRHWSAAIVYGYLGLVFLVLTCKFLRN
jgi:hypothetical protein